MSAAAAAAAADPAAPEGVGRFKGRKKKLILIGAVVMLLLLVAAAATVLVLRNKAAHAADDAADDGVALSAHEAAKADPAHPPAFLPLEPFVVNLADNEADRYAQVGIVLEVDSALFADQMKAYMPAIRNAILMILAGKTSRELLQRSGKEQLAEEIQRETVRPMGIDIAAPEPIRPKTADAFSSGADPSDAATPKQKPNSNNAAKRVVPHNPVRHVHFSNFIIQ